MLAWAVAPGNEVLQQQLNDALAELRSNRTLSYILNRRNPLRVEVR